MHTEVHAISVYPTQTNLSPLLLVRIQLRLGKDKRQCLRGCFKSNIYNLFRFFCILRLKYTSYLQNIFYLKSLTNFPECFVLT